jgi:hypothetical protein
MKIPDRRTAPTASLCVPAVQRWQRWQRRGMTDEELVAEARADVFELEERARTPTRGHVVYMRCEHGSARSHLPQVERKCARAGNLARQAVRM